MKQVCMNKKLARVCGQSMELFEFWCVEIAVDLESHCYVYRYEHYVSITHSAPSIRREVIIPSVSVVRVWPSVKSVV